MSADPRAWWRSLEQLAGDPRSREFLEREFLDGAAEPPEGLSRRSMLTLLGASLSLAGLTACRRPAEKIVPYVKAPEEIIPGVPLRYATVMPLGLAAHGLVVESHEGRPTKVEGNELHPGSLGASSAWMQAALLGLYDPDRSTGVRRGAEPKSWADFVAVWRERDGRHLTDRGRGVAVIARPAASPTLARLAGVLRERFPEALFAVHDPLDDGAVVAGASLAAGRPARPCYRFERASVVLSLDADFLLTETDAVRHARGFADARRVVTPADPMSRLWVVESQLSLTGANADHRLALQSRAVGAFLGLLAARLRRAGLDLPASAAVEELPGVEARWVDALASDLLSARGRGLVLAGRVQPAAVHATCIALNAALGNVGSTLTLHEPQDAWLPDRESLARVVAAMREGQVQTLAILGGNPVYDAPADLDFAAALGRVELSVHLSPALDETSRRTTWHVPEAHFLEAWGDARATDGTPAVIQPLIAPLLEGKSPVELLTLVATGEDRPGHDEVRVTWQTLLGAADFAARFNRVLHDGVLAGQTAAPVAPSAAAMPELPGAGAPDAGLELVFRPSPAVRDGQWANNGWLQELPDPITKLTWDNAALLDPQTAAGLGVRSGDRVRLELGGRALESAACVVPGQAVGSIQLHLGWGRQAAGRVGDGRGFDAYPLRTAAAPDIAGGLALSRASGSYPLSTTADHGTLDPLGQRVMAERVATIVREGTLAEFRAEPTFARERVHHPELESMWPERAYDEGHQWGMSIDLNACTGCNACVVACQSENNIPIVGKEQVALGREMHWIRVDRYFAGPPEQPAVAFQPMPCMHCENAPCEQVCPVAATVHDREGLNTMVYNRCIGTRYCSNNCPYKVRRFNFFNYTKDTPLLQQLAANPDVTVRSRGVMEKCSFCVQRINAARQAAKAAGRPLQDGDVTTACEQACPSRAIVFGDLRDAGSRVARRKAEPRDYVLLAELNNKPRTSYLARLRNPHPALAGEEA